MSETTAAFESELLAIAREAADVAGAELLARFRKHVEVRTKTTPTDPVSEADLAAEQAIRALLAQRRPSDEILGEEGGQTTGDGGAGSGLRWVVDPLDGTVNYLYGLPEFAVSVAVEDSLGGVAAVVFQPSTGERFTATRSGPALWHPGDGGEPVVLRGSGVQQLEQALIGTGFSYSPTARARQGQVVAGVLPVARDIRRIGSAALDLCWVAAARLDGYYERGVKAWDIAAGTLICQRAGVVVHALHELRDPDGEVLLHSGVLAAPAAFADELERLAAGAGMLD